MSWNDRIVRVVVTAACVFAALLVTMMLGGSTVFGTMEGSVIATVTLLGATALLDSALFGTRIAPETAGVVTGVALGFFLRQSDVSPELSAGAGRVASTAALLSVVLLIVRLWRRRQRA
jgi:hypothetical protein